MTAKLGVKFLIAMTTPVLWIYMTLLSTTSSSFSPEASFPVEPDLDKNPDIARFEEMGALAAWPGRRHSFDLVNALSEASWTDPASVHGSSKEPRKRSPRMPVYMLVLLPKATNFLFSIERVSPAITLATDNVTSSQFLPRHRLVTLYADSKCHIAEAMNEAFKFYIKGKVHAFFGPVCDYSMAPIARQAKYWNIPVITSGAMARDYSANKSTLYKTLTRVGSSFNKLIDFLAVLFNHYNYSKVNLVYEPNGQGHILDKLCHVMTAGIHDAFTKGEYNISNVPSKCELESDIEDVLRYKIGTRYGGVKLRPHQSTIA